MQEILDLYRTDLFWYFPMATAAISAFGFMLFAAPMTLLAAVDPPSLRRYRIQSRKPRHQDLVGPSIRAWLVNNLFMIGLIILSWPLLRLSGIHAGALPSWYVIALQVLFFIFLDDLLFYWAHRCLHTQWLYKRIHGWHHTILTPWAITGNYMHPVEFVIIGTLTLVGPILLGVHVVTLWLWLLVRQWEAAEGHCGYDFPWSPTHLLPFSDGAVHHDVHHARVRGNYAGFLAYADGLFGTYSRGYEESLRERRGWSAPRIA